MLKRSVLAAAGTVLPLLLTPVPVYSDSSVVCSDYLGGCVIVAEEDGASEGGGTEPDPPAEASDEDEPECDTEGENVSCSAEGTVNTVASPVQVAAQAMEQLPLPLPEISTAPDPSSTALVGLPVWLWVEDHDWSEVSQTASAGSVTVTATATPDRVEWDMGDGSTVTCYSAGQPYTSGASSSCTHTYERTSGQNPYQLTATVYWDISWSGGGSSGGQTLTRSSTSELSVDESQTIVQ